MEEERSKDKSWIRIEREKYAVRCAVAKFLTDAVGYLGPEYYPDLDMSGVFKKGEITYMMLRAKDGRLIQAYEVGIKYNFLPVDSLHNNEVKFPNEKLVD